MTPCLHRPSPAARHAPTASIPTPALRNPPIDSASAPLAVDFASALLPAWVPATKPPMALGPDGRSEGPARSRTAIEARMPGADSWWRAWVAPITAWHRRASGRSELKRLDARLLRDIGLSEEQAGREMAKPFWRA